MDVETPTNSYYGHMAYYKTAPTEGDPKEIKILVAAKGTLPQNVKFEGEAYFLGSTLHPGADFKPEVGSLLFVPLNEKQRRELAEIRLRHLRDSGNEMNKRWINDRWLKLLKQQFNQTANDMIIVKVAENTEATNDL
jgi:hypothetical protein